MFKTILKSAVCVGVLMAAGVAHAQLYVDSADGDLGGLSASPWDTSSADANIDGMVTDSGYVADTVAGPGSNAVGLTGNKVPLPTFVGENTTWTKAQGQKAIAPEVNIANMLIMTNHLRKLGYKIPPEFDEFIRNAPENYRKKIMGALQDIRDARNDKSRIVEYSFAQLLEAIEKQTGFDVTNLFGTTFDLLDEGPK